MNYKNDTHKTSCGFLVSSENISYLDFWLSMDNGEWEDETLSFIKRNAKQGTTLYDVGAWIGPVSLYASHLGAGVISIEPDPIAFAELAKNNQLNDNRLIILNRAISNNADPLTLYVKSELGDSETSALLKGRGAREISVGSMRLSELPQPEGEKIVKVDIEGFEYEILDQLIDFCRDAKALHLSIHPRNLGDKAIAWRLTSRLVRRFWEIFPQSYMRRLITMATVIRKILLKRRIKNFTVAFER